MGLEIFGAKKAYDSVKKKTSKLNDVKATPPPDPETAVEDAEAEAKKKAEERRKRIALRGQASTVKTSLMGLDSDASVKKKTLLGG